MKKISKRLLAIVMTLALAISFTATAFAAEPEEIPDDMYYTIVTVEDGIATIKTSDELPASVLATSVTFVDRTGSLRGCPEIGAQETKNLAR